MLIFLGLIESVQKAQESPPSPKDDSESSQTHGDGLRHRTKHNSTSNGTAPPVAETEAVEPQYTQEQAHAVKK